MQRELQRLVPYHLATERTSITGSATVTLPIQVPGDADFEARYITASLTSVNAVLTIRDGGTRLEIMNRAIFAALISGTGSQPYVLPAPALFIRNSVIEVVVQDLSGQTNVVQVVFNGFLVYPGPVSGGV